MTQILDGVIYGDTNFILPTHMNYGKFVVDKIKKQKDIVAFINGATDEKITLKELHRQIVMIASSLTKIGVKKGDVVAVCSENRPEFFISTLAIMCCGGTVTFFNSSYSKGEFAHTMGISKPKYLFLSPITYKTYYDTVKKVNIVENVFLFGDNKEQGFTTYQEMISMSLDVKTFEPVDFKGKNEVALILYSSGTTGLPKGAALTHRNLIVGAMQPPNVKSNLSYLSVVPWSNTFGIMTSVREILKGRQCVYLQKYNEKDYLNAIEKYRVGYLLIVPPLLVMLTKSSLLDKYDVSSVKLMYSGGAPLDSGVIEVAKKRFPGLKHVLQGYGTTETTGALTEETEYDNKLGSVGKIAAGNIAKIVDVETRKVLGPNQQGEVCVKGLVLFKGYIGKDIKEDSDEEGFYKTGDVAYYDEDGYFYITDRLKELIKYNAFQVAPSELEALLLQHPAVKDAAVIGTPDPAAGELPTAFVVRKDGEKVTEKEIKDYVANKVSHWKQLRGGVIFVDDIPKTPSGKILKRILKESLKPKSKL